MSETPPEPEVVTVDCWAVNVSGCSDATVTWWNDLEAGQQQYAAALAVAALRGLTGHRFNPCPILARPSREGCIDLTWRGYPVGIPSGAFRPYVAGGVWRNAVCGCGTTCTHPLASLRIPGMTEVESVTIDGDTLTPDVDYRVVGDRLYRLGDEVWPTCQNLALPVTEDGTFGVVYYAARPGDLGEQMAGVLAVEFARACTGTGGECGLPRGVKNITRQGVSVEVISSAFTNGITGIQAVDAWVTSVNPNRLKTPSTVWTPDVPHLRGGV